MPNRIVSGKRTIYEIKDHPLPLLKQLRGDPPIWIIDATVTAHHSNTDIVYIGDSNTLADSDLNKETKIGDPLEAGDTRYFVEIDITTLWIDAVVAGEGVSFNYTITTDA